MDKVAQGKKLVEIEWIRAICCILVIMIHVTAEFWTSFVYGSIQYKIIILLNTLSQFAVPGFISYSLYKNIEGVKFICSNKELFYDFSLCLPVICNNMCFMDSWYCYGKTRIENKA